MWCITYYYVEVYRFTSRPRIETSLLRTGNVLCPQTQTRTTSLYSKHIAKTLRSLINGQVLNGLSGRCEARCGTVSAAGRQASAHGRDPEPSINIQIYVAINAP